MVNIKHAKLFALSIGFLMVGVLGVANVQFFASNMMEENYEIL